MNPILLQKQLRENATNLEDFAKDLKSWGEEMKRKESAITGVKQVPMQRKIKKVSADSKKILGKSKKPTTKLGATDYRAWEKFDADAEIEKLEDDINDDSELTDECNEKEYDQAVLEKEKGNKFVKVQKWDEAIKCYSKAIECYSYDPIFYANRALCYLKKEIYENAEKDCNLSLKLDPNYVKALQRRAAARIEMQKFDNAEQDLLKVLEHEPRNMESKKELEKLRSKMNRNGEMQSSEQRPVSKFTLSRNKSKGIANPVYKPVSSTSEDSVKIKLLNEPMKTKIDESKPFSSWPTQEDIILVKPINKKPHLRSQKPLRRIKIKELNDQTIESVNEEINKKKEFEEQSVIASPKPKEQICSITCDTKVEKKNVKEDKNNSNNNIINKLHEKHVEENVVTSSWETPKTSVQFYSIWKNLTTFKDKYTFFKIINPLELPKIFLNSLESNVFSDILEVLAESCTENKDPVASILQNLANVKRFDTLTMFMTSNDKKNLWKLFDHIKETSEVSKVEVDKLIKKYEL